MSDDNTQNTAALDEARAALTAERAALDKAASELIAAQVATLPEALRDLMPANASAADKLAWIARAKAAAPKVTTPAAVDQRRPNNTPAPVDASSLPPIARIAAGYNKN